MELTALRRAPPPPNHRRLIVLGVVVAFQVLIIYLVQSGLAKMMIDRVAGPLETRLIEEVQEVREAPPPPPPTFKAPPPVVIDMPVVTITEAPAASSIDANARATKQEVPVADVIIPPKQNPRRPIPSPEEMYPAMSKRLGEEGAVTLLLTVGDDGRVTEATVKESSGFERLDSAAATEAKKSWRFIPGTKNGKPASMQVPFRVVFKISK